MDAIMPPNFEFLAAAWSPEANFLKLTSSNTIAANMITINTIFTQNHGVSAVQATILEPEQQRPANQQGNRGDFAHGRHVKANPEQRRAGLLVNPGKRCADDRHYYGVGTTGDEGHDMNPKQEVGRTHLSAF